MGEDFAGTAETAPEGRDAAQLRAVTTCPAAAVNQQNTTSVSFALRRHEYVAG